MMPTNQKSMYAHICKTIEKLDSGEIDASTAKAHAQLVQVGVNLINTELKRAVVMSVLSKEGGRDRVREIEVKSFDALP